MHGATQQRVATEPVLLRALFFVSSLIVVGALTVGLVAQWSSVRPEILTIGLWAAVAAIGDLLPVRLWGGVTLSMSLPITLAAGMVLSPLQAGIVAFTSSLDPREFRGQVTLARALYNRSQVAISVLAASAAFHGLHGNAANWPEVLIPGLVSIAVDSAINIMLVMVHMAFLMHLTPAEVLSGVHGDAPIEHAAGYVCLGLMALLLSTAYITAGESGLVAFLVPLVLARQMFLRGRRLEEAARQLESKDRALVVVADQTLQERRDERMAVAGELHDEVLPPLFKVHLMGQVLRQDLNSGRLLDLDVDIPELLAATEEAQRSVRCLVRDLRQSSLGPGGLNSTLELFARQLESAGSCRIHFQLAEVGGTSLVQLITYQIAREALNNAARHAKATRINVALGREGDWIRLVVEDDGVGFDVRHVNRDSHFGLQLMTERVEAVHGTLFVDSQIGSGTRIVALIPPDVV
jgi:signal transduction histidine kinase